SRRRHTRCLSDWSSDVCSSDLAIVDIGGESTRPGSAGVSLDEELRRVVPVLERLQGDVPVSIDTAKAGVARRALELGAELVNDEIGRASCRERAYSSVEGGCVK